MEISLPLTIGPLEFIIGATILLLLLIWWLWPKHERTDLSAPPASLAKDGDKPAALKPRQGDDVQTSMPQTNPSQDPEHDVVRNESDYSEEELMMRDVRAALHRGRKIEAIRRVRQSTGLGLAEAKDFVEQIERSKLQ